MSPEEASSVLGNRTGRRRGVDTPLKYLNMRQTVGGVRELVYFGNEGNALPGNGKTERPRAKRQKLHFPW